MKINPIPDVLPQAIDASVQNELNRLSEIVSEFTNLGMHLYAWDLEQAKGGEENIPPLLLFRNILELLDSIAILIRHSSTDPCKLIIRTILESKFYLDYLFKELTYQRSMAYLVWHTHEEINVLNKYSSDTAQGKAFQQTLDADQRFNINVSELAKKFEIEKMITSKMTMLGYPQFIDAEQEYQKVKKTRNHIFWYHLYNGPTSIKKLAEYLGESALYEMHYGGHSGSIHGTKVMHGLYNKPAEGMTEFVQIRYARDAKSVVKEALTFCLSTFNLYLENRVPQKRPEYLSLYRLIRGDFLTL